MRLLVAFSLPGVFLYMVLVSLSFICRALFPPAQFIIRVLFFFAEFISSCAKRGSGAGPGDWQHTTRLASECQVGASRSAISSSCPGQGHQPAPWGGGQPFPPQKQGDKCQMPFGDTSALSGRAAGGWPALYPSLENSFLLLSLFQAGFVETDVLTFNRTKMFSVSDINTAIVHHDSWESVSLGRWCLGDGIPNHFCLHHPWSTSVSTPSGLPQWSGYEQRGSNESRLGF